MHNSTSTSTRRMFLRTTASAAAGSIAFPTLLLAKKTAGETIIGAGDYRYRVDHQWPRLPDKYSWQTTHNVAVDSNNNLYVIHEGHREKPDHPAIFVFDSNGQFIKSFGNQFQGGGHGIEIRQEGGEDFLYVCAYQQVKSIAKLDTNGETVWQKFAPMQSGKYAEGEATNPKQIWGRDRFLPTNFAFLPDGDFLLVDGYGSYFVHRYDRDGNWKSCFGGPGDGEGTFNTPHGIWLDARSDSEPTVAIADRAHHTVQYLDLEGRHLNTIEGFGLPANFDTFEDLLLVPELFARVTLLDKRNQVVARLGDDSERIRNDAKFEIRANEASWRPGKFVHPHDACFDRQGNIFVAEWVNTGRVTKLTRLS